MKNGEGLWWLIIWELEPEFLLMKTIHFTPEMNTTGVEHPVPEVDYEIAEVQIKGS
jgi:hypothetical protein